MKMDTMKIKDIIKGPLLAINGKFNQSTKNINDFMGEALQLYDNVKKKLSEKESLKAISVKNSDLQFPTLLGKGLQIQKQAKYSTVSVSSILTDKESSVNIMEDTVAARTRGALKARESKITLHVSTNVKYGTRTRGRNNKNTTSDSSASAHKRSAEYEMQEEDCFKKKKLASTKNENDNKVFKKPKTRGRGKAVKNQETESVKSLSNSTLEESQFFNAPLFFTSSPKINRSSPRTNNALLTPKQSNKKTNYSTPNMKAKRHSKKSLNEGVSTPSPVPASNDFINEDKNTESDKNIPTVESNISNTVTELEKHLSRDSNRNMKRKESLPDSPKLPTPTTSESFSKNQSLEDDLLPNSKKSNRSQSRNSRETSSSKKIELDDPPKSNVTIVLEKSEKESPVQEIKSRDESANTLRVTRSRTSRLKASQVKNSPDLIPSPSGKDPSSAAGGCLDTTKNVREASKRTKPVLKSKIFDEKGNILLGESENEPIKKKTAEKTYSLRSSPRTHSLNSPAGKEKKEKETTEKKTSQNERSKRTRGRDAQKKQEVIDIPADTGRVTRTKTKKAKEEQENAGRKSGLSLLARKSLNKAKIMSLKKEKLKAIQSLATRFTNQKGQSQMPSLKVYSHSKNHGSLQSVAVPCLKSTENLINSGKGKYLPLYNERTNTLITPAKRGETGDLLIKSAAKIAKENEIDKELKLKALKEKEEEAWVKREMAIKNRQKELKEKNEMKLQSAMKQRQKLETEKHNNILQSEKEKEAKTKLLLQEIELKRKEDVRKKKMEAEKKQAEAEERKRLKEEARKAKEKEQEAERQRILMGKEKEMERHQKWAQERLADEQAREKYENKLKEQLMKAKALSSKKPDKTETTVTIWNYKSRNENDFGLEDELSENDSNDEEPAPSARPIPKWAKRVLGKQCPTINVISQDMMAEYMKCLSKTPDIQKMFKMTPRKKIKRTSSAIWNTPSS